MPSTVADARALHKSYRDGRGIRRVLDGVSIDVGAGQVVAVRGPSGCGKTTLLEILAGILRHDSGSVTVANHEIDHSRPRDVARLRRTHVGWMSQTYGLIDDESVLANITLPLRFGERRTSRAERRAEAVRVLEQVALDVDLDAKVAHVSQGEKQRIALARALVRRPTLLVADEPTAALDATAGERVVERLRAAAAGQAAVVLATHDPRVADACDVVYTFDGPTLVAS